MRRFGPLCALLVAACGSSGGGGNHDKPNPFLPRPECSGVTVMPFAGSRQLVVSTLAIADADRGLDLDGDGKPDNKLAALGAIANSAVRDALTKRQIVLPIELYGYSGADATCAKLAFFVGQLDLDRDHDGVTTTLDHGDCDDTNPAVNPNAHEDLTNNIDDDCDGFADNPTRGSKPTGDPRADQDGDGYTIAMGDCDDRPGNADAAKRHPGAVEICGDGIDQDCNGIADDGPNCNPFAENDVTIPIQRVSLDASMQPLISFKDGAVAGGVLTAGPDRFALTVPFSASANVSLELGGAHLALPLTDDGTHAHVKSGLLGGVLQATTLANIKGLDFGGILVPAQSLLDAVFAGPIADVLGLDKDADQHARMDMDVDGDGYESFWSSDPTASPAHVDRCRDGDGTVVMGTDCPLAKDAHGNFRFVDGLSLALQFNAVPAKLGQLVP